MNVYTPSANKVVHRTRADLSRRQIEKPIHIVQYDDKLPVIAVELFHGGTAYTIPNGANANIRFGKKDGTIVYSPALGCDSARHILYLEVTAQMTLFDGCYDAVAEILVDGGTVATSAIHLEIDRNPAQEGSLESTDEVLSIIGYASAAEASAASAASSASAASASATAAKTSASAAKTSETNAASSASSASASAAAAKTSETNAKSSETNAASSASASAASAGEAKTAESSAKSAQSAAEKAQADAEAARDDAEAAKSAAENAQDAAEKVQTDVEAAKGAAEAAKSASETAMNSASAFATSAASSAATAKQYSGKPAIPLNGTWWIWNAESQQYEDTTFTCELEGPTGNGIETIELTSGDHTPGTTDIYTITMTDGSTKSVSVYNGLNGTGSGDTLGIQFDIVIPASGWADGKQSIADSRFVALKTHKYFIAADIDSEDEWLECKVKALDITEDGVLTFENEMDPLNDLVANVFRVQLAANGTS